MSESWNVRLYKVDLLGIMGLILGSYGMGLYYGFYCNQFHAGVPRTSMARGRALGVLYHVDQPHRVSSRCVRVSRQVCTWRYCWCC